MAAVRLLSTLHVSEEIAYAGLLVVLLGLVALCVGLVGLWVRRLHDVNATGFLVLGLLILNRIVPVPAGWPVVIADPSMLIWTLVLAVVPGDAGPNRYGEAPGSKDPSAVEPVAKEDA